ncbi:hypothetical protein EAG_01174 [Camponotus floridanus]|uniref:Uncharacterized protein n=1 Tax=Camponotus floridanus TaxID=104421 RepID=E2B1F3_CAMFO|nr:hypothetical protein EAG_01174 [Camponotus floridanus]
MKGARWENEWAEGEGDSNYHCSLQFPRPMPANTFPAKNANATHTVSRPSRSRGQRLAIHASRRHRRIDRYYHFFLEMAVLPLKRHFVCFPKAASHANYRHPKFQVSGKSFEPPSNKNAHQTANRPSEQRDDLSLPQDVSVRNRDWATRKRVREREKEKERVDRGCGTLSEIVIVVVGLPASISAGVVGDEVGIDDLAAARIEHREQLFRGGVSISANSDSPQKIKSEITIASQKKTSQLGFRGTPCLPSLYASLATLRAKDVALARSSGEITSEPGEPTGFTPPQTYHVSPMQ